MVQWRIYKFLAALSDKSFARVILVMAVVALWGADKYSNRTTIRNLRADNAQNAKECREDKKEIADQARLYVQREKEKIDSEKTAFTAHYIEILQNDRRFSDSISRVATSLSLQTERRIERASKNKR